MTNENGETFQYAYDADTNKRGYIADGTFYPFSESPFGAEFEILVKDGQIVSDKISEGCVYEPYDKKQTGIKNGHAYTYYYNSYGSSINQSALYYWYFNIDVTDYDYIVFDCESIYAGQIYGYNPFIDTDSGGAGRVDVSSYTGIKTIKFNDVRIFNVYAVKKT